MSEDFDAAETAAAKAKPLNGATYSQDGTNLTVHIPIAAVLCLPNAPAILNHVLVGGSFSMDRLNLTIEAPLASLRLKPVREPSSPVLKAQAPDAE